MKTHHKLLISLCFGALFGLLLNSYNDNSALQVLNVYFLEPLGQIFLRGIFMIVVPMVVSGLIIGVYQLTSHNGLAKIAKRTLYFTILASAASVFIGVSLVNTFKPGESFKISSIIDTSTKNIEKIKQNVQDTKPITQAIVEIIPKNPIEAATKAFDGEMLALMFFALIFGMALSKQNSSKGTPRWISLFEECYETCMTIVEWFMKLAPYAVFALVFQSTFKFGHQILISLGYYVAIVLVGLLIQQFGTYTLLLKLFTKRKPWKFYNDCRDVYLYAFATASSNATLPQSLETAEHKLKLHPEISRFVLTIGSTANQNGTALFEGITVLFLAQVYGVHLDLFAQTKVVLMSILAGIGTAGVPGGSLPLIMILLQQMGIPPEGLGLILGVDRFLDMCRTTLNVSGDLVISALVDEKK